MRRKIDEARRVGEMIRVDVFARGEIIAEEQEQVDHQET